MKYKIIVDKQSRTNPSSEKKEYEIDIEELRTRRNVYDSIVITRDEAYVLRRFTLSDLMVLSELEEPIKEPLPDLNIELFEGDNYIYLIDMTGNKFYAEYLIKNEFNELYVTLNQMNSAINQSANEIELTVNQKLEGYSTTEEMNAAIQITADGINSEVSKKVGEDEIISKINQSAETVTIDAEKININGTISANGNFKVDKNGNMSCNNGTFNGGTIELNSNSTSYSNASFKVKSSDGSEGFVSSRVITLEETSSTGIPAQLIISLYQNDNPRISLIGNNLSSNTEISSEEITTPVLTQTSLESIKKNIEKTNVNALELIKNSDVYEYNLKTEEDTDKKHIGFVIGDKYNTPKEVIANSGEGIDTYSMSSIMWKAIQELTAKVEQLEKEVANAKN